MTNISIYNPEYVREIVSQLRNKYSSVNRSDFVIGSVINKPLFDFIIAVILSQNTSDRNAIKAYNNLVKLFGSPLDPVKLLESESSVIINAIKPAGMYSKRYRWITDLAKLFVNKDFVENLVEYVKNNDVDDSRRKLLELPGIGYKTADVILLIYFNKPSFPVDTHIMRITKRLTSLRSLKYEDVRMFWMNNLEPSEYFEVHILLITHGREICRAKKPLCEKCVINKKCRYYSKM